MRVRLGSMWFKIHKADGVELTWDKEQAFIYAPDQKHLAEETAELIGGTIVK